MHIAVHAATLRGFGSSLVGQRVLRAVAAEGHTLRAWIPDSWGWSASELGRSCELIPLAGGIQNKLRSEVATIRGHLSDCDVLLSLGDTSVVGCPIPHLLLVQQAYVATPPDLLDFPRPARFRARMRLMSAWFRATAATTTHFTVQTENMRHQLGARYGIAPERITVIRTPIEPLPPAPRRPGDSICVVASASPHKDFGAIADVLQVASGVHARVSVNAAEVPELVARAEQLGVADRIEYLGTGDRTSLGRVVAESLAMLMPSRLESYGMPLYEAMAAGCPVVALDRPYAREACGDAALYGADSTNMGHHIRRLSASPEEAERLSQAGRARFASMDLSPAATARAYLEILERIAR